MPVKAISSIGRLQVVADGEGLTSRAGTALVAGVADQVGLTAGLSAALEGLRAERVQQLQRVAQAVGDALEHGSDERAAVVAQPEAREGRPRARVCVRRALALEVGLEEQPLGAGRPRLGLAQQLLVGRAAERRP